ncbi:MAG: DUF2231 domain-containing protein [Petrimonas sp.]|nr:DUF2231 domain-containing protein [Petrimonas sp.]MEA4979318.1 DUF2231 domain-containing protein [Petrimonas sp.]MEA5063692.1 DUF2231 domain-containing protein [Petrimonas sp.]
MFTVSHLHPMLVHFPIALVSVGFLLEISYFFCKKEVCLTRAGYYLLIIGTLAAAATWLSGMLFTSEMEGSAGQIRETHELFATVTLVLLLIAASIRIYLSLKKKEDNKTLKNMAFVLYALATVSVFITGFFGGTLVYNYMMPI